MLVAIGSLSLWLAGRTPVQEIPAALTRVITKEGEKSHIYLSDATEITLNAKSSLEYDQRYDITERVVKLNGEAFFNVNTNPDKPFIVELNQMKITATGTRFNVFSFPTENRIETTLLEGSIHVSINNECSCRSQIGTAGSVFCQIENLYGT
jgi:transmembrane sensor